MITVACCFWDANAASFSFSRMYDETWVAKLAAGFRRNLTRPHRFVCFTERERAPLRGVEWMLFEDTETRARPDVSALIEPFRLNEPCVITGLDTVVVGNCDRYADYCLTGAEIAAPRDPYHPHKACNGVVLSPAGMAERMWGGFDGRNDMDWINANPHVLLDSLFPGEIVSYKAHVRGREADALARARIVYFHGEQKPHQLCGEEWVREHWAEDDRCLVC